MFLILLFNCAKVNKISIQNIFLKKKFIFNNIYHEEIYRTAHDDDWFHFM